MRVLVINLGSTSFKFKLLDMARNGWELAAGRYDRIGKKESSFASHEQAMDEMIRTLKTPPDAIGFKAVHGGPISGAVRVDEHVMQTMEQFSDVAPAHNPAYVSAMKLLSQRLSGVPQVAAFETAFHQGIPLSRQLYGIPWQWTEELGIRKYGFHGASHRYIAARVYELLGKAARRVISCHLGGSSSVCGIDSGHSVFNSFGMTPQSGIFHNNRVGDFDTFALLRLAHHKIGLEPALRRLTQEGGLLGISGLSNDMREVESAAKQGDARARLAVDAFVEAVRHHIGAALVALAGCDVLVFTGGIGENAIEIRQAVCEPLHFAGLSLDENKNRVRGQEAKVSAVESSGDIWVIPTNEELIVARQTVDVLTVN